MAKLSNIIITTLNILTTTLALAFIGTFIYLHFLNPTHCNRALERPVLAIGLTLFVVSLFGLIGSAFKVKSLLWAYIVVLFLLILGWLVFSIFVLSVTKKGARRAISGFGFREYRVEDYSHWLKKHVVNERNWDGIKSCLVGAKVCNDLNEVVYVKDGTCFPKEKLTLIQSSCCKPPTSCGFTPKNATYWEAPKTGSTTSPWSDSDCETWSNNAKKLCYNCNSCKGAVLGNLRKEWRTFSIINIVILVILLVIYIIGCCAINNKDRHFSPKLVRSSGFRVNFFFFDTRV